MDRPLVLITRPAGAAADDFAQSCQDLGYETLHSPLLVIKSLPFEMPKIQNDYGIIFTSAQAVRCVFGHIEDKKIPVLTVGPQTKIVAEKYGFENVHSVDGNAQNLTDYIVRNKDIFGQNIKKYIYFSAQDVRVDVTNILHNANISAGRICVYKAEEAADFLPEAQAAFVHNKINIVTLFSVRTAQHFVKLIQNHRWESHLKHITLLSISDAVLECVRSLPWQNTYTVYAPNGDSMLEALKGLRRRHDEQSL